MMGATAPKPPFAMNGRRTRLGACAAASMSGISGTVICPAVPREGRLAAGDHPFCPILLIFIIRV